MTGPIALSIIELIVFMIGAITLGFTIHFFIVSRRSIQGNSPLVNVKIRKELQEKKIRYLNDIDARDKEISSLRHQLDAEQESGQLHEIEASELRKQNKKLQADIEKLKAGPAFGDKSGFLSQVRQAEEHLLIYHDKINRLLDQIDLLKESEEEKETIRKENEALSREVDELRELLIQQDESMRNDRKKEEMTNEMSSMIDSAYEEFNLLQEKMQKLEGQFSQSKKINLEAEDLREESIRLSRQLEEQRSKYSALLSRTQQLEKFLAEAEDKLKEANFQRQQMQKKIAYLEGVNLDMQAISDTNKKLEAQIKRIGELESQISLLAQERDQLARRQT